MENCTVSRNFSTNKYSDEGLATKSQVIHDDMNGNEHYPNPDPSLDILQTAIIDYKDAIVKATNGSKDDTAIKNARRQIVEDCLHRLSYYVQVTSNGVEAVILSSGFDINKNSGTVGVLPKPENFKVMVGDNKGTVELSCDAVANASFYEYQYTKLPLSATSIWTMRTATKRKLLVEGLTSGQQYVFKMAAGGSDPSRTWSDEITSYIL